MAVTLPPSSSRAPYRRRKGDDVVKHIPYGRRIVWGLTAPRHRWLGWAGRPGKRSCGTQNCTLVYAREDTQRCRAPYAAHYGLPGPKRIGQPRLRCLPRRFARRFTRPHRPGCGRNLRKAIRNACCSTAPSAPSCSCLAAPGGPVTWRMRRAPVHRACLRGAPCPVVIVRCVRRSATDWPGQRAELRLRGALRLRHACPLHKGQG